MTVDMKQLKAAQESERGWARRQDELGREAKAATKRLAEINQELAQAIAGADARAISDLRAERSRLEVTLRDSEAAQKVARTNWEAADRALAFVQLTAVRGDAAAAVECLEAAVRELVAAGRAYDDARRAFIQTRGRAVPDPNEALRIEPPSPAEFAARLAATVRDVTLS